MIMHSVKHNTVAEEELFLLPGYQDQLRSTLSNSIYDNLPEPLRDLFTTIDNPYERDILLLGTLTVLSGCMPNVIGFYDRKWVSPNLYTFIEAPAGSGKGVLSWTRLVGMEIHKMLLEETTLAKKQFEELKREKIKLKDADVSALKEPPYKLLFVPANNSASSVVQTLSENDGAGILFSTEADTLANALAQTRYGGAVAACGLAQGFDLPTTVMPFILRSVRLIGVDSVMAPLALRQQAWARLAQDLDMAKLESMIEEVDLDHAAEKAHALMAGQVRGRVVVRI